MENSNKNENIKIILDEESTDYLNAVRLQIKSKFQEYIDKLQSKEEILLKLFNDKITDTQILKNKLSSSIQEKEQIISTPNQTSNIAEETKSLKDILNLLCDKVEKLELAKESLYNSKLSDIFEILDDDFRIKFNIADSDLSYETQLDSKSPAGKPTRNICGKCRNVLEWNQNYCSNNCDCTNTNRHYKYGCNSCDISYCTICCFPVDISMCGCGKKLDRTHVYSHNCDLCRQTIRTQCYRCTDCDYDVCEACYAKYK
jgi:hypothetical protein